MGIHERILIIISCIFLYILIARAALNTQYKSNQYLEALIIGLTMLLPALFLATIIHWTITL